MRSMTRFRALLPAALLILAASVQPVGAAGPEPVSLSAVGADLRLLRVTPAGEDVEAGSQIVFSFDRAVVPLGRMERTSEEVPITITPDVACDWRWIDPQALACQLGEGQALHAATRYTVIVRPEFVTESGAKLVRGITQSFVTERPALRYSNLLSWPAPSVPLLRTYFNQPVSAASVAASLKVGGADVEVLPEVTDQQTPYWIPARGGEAAGEARRTWLIKTRTALPPDRDGTLRINPGLRSAFGNETGIERRDTASFHTFPAPSFLGLRCADVDGGETLFIAAGSVQSALCNPLGSAALVFASPVLPAEVKRSVHITPDPTGGHKDYDPWANAPTEISFNANTGNNAGQRVYLPFTLKADAEYHLAGGDDLKDVFGRTLGSKIDMSFRTAHRSAAINFEHTASVLEQGVDSEVPLFVTNLERLRTRGTAITAEGAAPEATSEIPVDKVQDLAFGMPLGIRKLLGGKSGVFDGWLRTDPRTEINASNDGKGEHFFAEVTPWQVHVKLGHYNTLVWVTEFATGKPVANAEVEIFAAQASTWQPSGDIAPAKIQTDAGGLAELPGTETVDPRLEHGGYNPKTSLAVRVKKGADLALVPLDYDFNVDIYRASRYQVSASRQRRYGHLKSWGTTAQGVYRAGDAIQYKVYVRNDANKALAPAPKGPYALKVYDPGDQVVYEQSGIQLSAFGAFDGQFTVPKQGKVGWYRFELTPSFSTSNANGDDSKPGNGDDENGDDDRGSAHTLQPMRVLVSDFTPAPFKLSAEIRTKLAEPGQKLAVSLQASLHAGGPFAGAPASLAATIVATPFVSEDAVASKFRFGAFDGDNEEGGARNQRQIAEKKSVTNAAGEFQTEITPPANDIAWGKLVVEGSAQDDRGRAIAATASVPYAGRDRFIGLRSPEWLLEQGKTASVETLVVDASGKPVAGTPGYVKVERREVTVARVKDVGNVYVARYSEKWVGVQVCKGRSTITPTACRFKPDAGGIYRITASARDTQNRLHSSSLWLFSSGKNSFLWSEPDDYGLELVADKKTYKVGDTARFLVKNPYPGASALITTERYGVIEKRVQTLEGSAPVVEIKITPDLLPGFYLSVVVQSPRVASPPPQGDVDLGKPTFRMGYAKVTVDDPYKKISVDVQGDKARYKPRETAKVSLVAKPEKPLDGGEKMEFAVVVIDEAVYDLILGGADYFDPYKGFNALDSLDLANYSLLTRLVGRQKFEKKGATPGGDGGADLSLRSVDQFVAYWNPSLAVDSEGKASFEFTLPDNLTAWKVLVLAVTPGDRMGLGSGKLISTRDTELRPVMPNQVSSGDTFQAGFSVLNRADKPRTLSVALEATGAASTRKEENVMLAPFERKTLLFDVAPQLADNAPGEIRFTATAGDAQDKDGLKLSVPVRPRKPTVTAADFGFLDSGDYLQSILVPEGSLPGGAISVSFTPTVLGNLDGAFKYVRDYPYLCWEQRLTKGVMASNYLRLKGYLDPRIAWPGANEQVMQMFTDAASFQALNGGMTFWDGDEAHVSPYLSAYTALAFEWLRGAGYNPPEAVQAKLDGYLDGVLRRDVPDGSLEASSAVRAVALSALASRGKLKAADIERYAPSAPRMGLFGQSLFLQAAIKTPGAEAQVQPALDLVLAHGQESAGTFVLRETDDSFWAWILGSPLRSNCAALSALVSLPARSLDSNPSLAEIPAKLVRSITQERGGRDHTAKRYGLDHWENTQENVFCTSALNAYSQRYESIPPNFVMKAALDAKPIGPDAKFTALRDTPITVQHPIIAADIGRKQDLSITHEGQGRGYFAARVSYVESDENARAANAGLQIKRSYAVKREGKWQPLISPIKITRGELVRIELTLSSPSARNFVVVDDPVPGGLEPVNPDLATSSGLDAAEASPPGSADPYPFYHRELRFDAARWFADQLEAGTYRLYWIGQAVATGQFAVLATHAEEMYDPDVFGNDVPGRLVVEEATNSNRH